MIGTLRTVVIDTRRPAELAGFYRELIGGDVDATAIPGVGEENGEDNFRVYRDPAGHTFCLVWGVPRL